MPLGSNDLAELPLNLYASMSTDTSPFYKFCLLKLKKLYETYSNYPTKSLEHYLLNPYRLDLSNVKVSEVKKFLRSKGYGTKEINLLLKI